MRVMVENKWNVSNIPDMNGRLAVITGGNSGIGLEAAKALAGKGAHVILAVRNQEKGDVAAADIRRLHPSAVVDVMPLNLTDLASVRAFAETFHTRFHELHLLINNAGVMAIPRRQTTDGFEMQFGTNHLGHFALTGLLLPTLLATPKARVVTVSSLAHTRGGIDFDNLDGSRRYSRWGAYGQSKLANLLFAYTLQRRLAASGADVLSVACHPGVAATNLATAGLGKVAGALGNLMAQSAAMGALPTLYAATDASIQGGEYIGPTGGRGMRGYPGRVQSSPRSHETAVAQRLWDISETLTGVSYDGIL